MLKTDIAVNRYNFSLHFEASEIDDITKEFANILKNGDYILSDYVREFESDFAKFVGTNYCIGCNSGTDALILALRSLEIGIGDEVIVPANTFYATALAICVVGAKPVLIDANEQSFLIDENLISKKITKKTKAILAVHLYGSVCNMKALTEICQQNRIFLIEDCAQAHGAKFNTKSVGSFGTLGCFSFHPSKNLPAMGDAGACVTNNHTLSERINILRHLGQKVQNEHILLGMNSRLDTIQAFILSKRLKKLSSWNEKRRIIANHYIMGLEDLPIQFQNNFVDSEPVYHLFQIRVQKRDKLLSYLLSRKIDSVIRYPYPIHLQDSFRFLNYKADDFPVSINLSKQLLCLPINPDLSMEQINHVIQCVREFYEK